MSPKWLKTKFLPWIDEWENQVKNRKDLDAYEQERRLLSRETMEGIRITGTVQY